MNGRGTSRSGANATEKEDLTFKERLAALRNLPRFFSLIWRTSPALTLANIFLRLIRSAIPVAVLYVGKLIIDQIVHHLQQPAASQSYLWKLVALEFALAIGSDALNRLIILLDGLLGDLFSNQTSIKIMQHAALLDLDQFEDSLFYDKLERARQQTTGRTVLLSQVFSQVQDSTLR